MNQETEKSVGRTYRTGIEEGSTITVLIAKRGSSLKTMRAAIVALGTVVWIFSAVAQEAEDLRQGPPPGDRYRDGDPPLPPIEAALDVNGDGTIDADEIANAPLALKSLDKNDDGRLTTDEFRPPKPPRKELGQWERR